VDLHPTGALSRYAPAMLSRYWRCSGTARFFLQALLGLLKMAALLILIFVILGIGVWINNFAEMFFTSLVVFGIMCALFQINPFTVFLN
jgi:hypothetical protein